MARSIWRWSHLILALVASSFLILSAISGFFLALESIYKKVNQQSFDRWKEISVDECIETLTSKYFEVTSLEKNEEGVFIASVLTDDGEFLTIPINPETGEKVGKVVEQNSFFEWMTTFHRSLFLDTTGRFLVGFVSILLILITISGLILIFQRSKSFKSFFNRVEKTTRVNYYHVILSRFFFIPILIISITGGYLFLQRFEVIKEEQSEPLVVNLEAKSSNKEKIDFSTLYLGDIDKIEFPFSPDEEDYFILYTPDGEMAVHQYNFNVLGKVDYSNSIILKRLSLVLHTGSSNTIWAFILGVASLSVLYFIYSGLKMFFLKRKGKIKNNYKLSEAEVLLLVGSESGSTLHLAKLFFESLISNGTKVFFAEMNDYKPSENIKDVVVFTATYGLGEAPANSNQFLAKWNYHPLQQKFNYSIVGFGSLNYPDFCQFAIDVQNTLKASNNANQLVPLVKIHNQSYHSFKNWATSWEKASGYEFSIPASIVRKKLPLHQFKVIHKQSIIEDDEETFTLTLKRTGNFTFESGDLLAIYPTSDPVERLYSIGKLNDMDLIISVKKHKQGVCSNFLASLDVGATLEAGIKQNKDFHFNDKKPSVFIGNGTGIAPFLGMIANNAKKQEVHLYWGGRTKKSYGLYEEIVGNNLEIKHLVSTQLAFSRETDQKVYVGDLLLRDASTISQLLKKDGVLYICGSLEMQQSVLETLELICNDFTNKSLSYYQQKGRIKMDCY